MSIISLIILLNINDLQTILRCCSHESSISKFPKAALVPPAAKTVWKSVLGLFPRIQTSRSDFFTSMAHLKPAPPQPITRTFDI